MSTLPAGASYSDFVYALSKAKSNFKAFKWTIPKRNVRDEVDNSVTLGKAGTVEFKQ
jgi:hypothetical protein